MLIASVSPYGEQFRVGRVKLLTCQKCNAIRAHYDLLDYTIEWREKWEGGLLLQEGSTRSGAHFCEKLSDVEWLPSFQGDMKLGKFRFIPEEGLGSHQSKSIGRFTCDFPFKHILHIVLEGGSEQEIEEIVEPESECPRCFRNRLQESSLRQGHLFLAKVEGTQQPRLFGGETGVTVYAGNEKEAIFELFNHEFAVNHGSIISRNNYGTIKLKTYSSYLTVASDDHPWPRQDVD